MGNRNNDELDVLHRRKQVVELYLQGWSQPAIADHLQVSQPTICGDLKAIRQDWRDSTIRDFDELRATELQKLDLIEREAWGAWQRSQKPAQSAVVTGEGQDQRARKSMKHQYGDPRFLQLVSHCIGQRRAILGLDVLLGPVQQENPWNDNVNLDARRERILTLVAAIGQRERIGGTGTPVDHSQPGDVRAGDERRAVEDGPPSRLPGPDSIEFVV